MLWLTGGNSVDKSAIARLVEKKLYYFGRHTALIDSGGDGKVENPAAAAAIAGHLADAGLIVLVAVEAPLASQRQQARDRFAPEEFIEIFIDAYSGAAGVAALEPPNNPEIVIAGNFSAEEAAERIVTELYGDLPAPDNLLGAGI